MQRVLDLDVSDGKVWLTTELKTIDVLDATNLKDVTSIPLADAPADITSGNGVLWVATTID